MDKIGERITNAAPAIGVMFSVIGLTAYMVAVVRAFFLGDDQIRDTLLDNAAANIGIPCSALAAFVLVSVLWSRFPPQSSAGEGAQLQIKILGLEFTGPSGPISLWVVCFLAFIVAVRMLMLDRA